MPAKRLPMRKTREILRIRWHLGQSVRVAATSCGVSVSTVVDTEARARAAGLAWPLPEGMDDDSVLEAGLYPRRPRLVEHAVPDFSAVHRELKRKGVTLELLWLEYKQTHGERAYSYSRLCELYADWRGTLDVVMRQTHRAGEKLFVDWAGQMLPLVNGETGEITDKPVFVAALGASNFTYVEVCPDQTSRSWVLAHVRAFEFLGGVPEVLVPDNLKTGVIKPDFFEPSLHQAYLELANYYGVVILPARVAKPRDKPKVENAVQQAERWVLAPLRDQKFFSVFEMNAAVMDRLTWLNDRPFSRLEGSRRSQFLEIDRPALHALPIKRMESSEWKVNVGVGIDHHVEFDHHFYSVPYELIRKRVDVRATLVTIEVLSRGVRVASHVRSSARGRYTTDNAHRPKAHQRYLEWSPERMEQWAAKIGEETSALVRHVLLTKPHPEQGFRSCLGVIRLADRCGKERVEAACRRARAIGSPTYTSVKSILASGLDAMPLPEGEQGALALDHGNVRGPKYYH